MSVGEQDGVGSRESTNSSLPHQKKKKERELEKQEKMVRKAAKQEKS